MIKESFNTNWQVKRIDNDSDFKMNVTIPFDAMLYQKRVDIGRVGSKKGYFENGTYEYIKVFEINEDKKDKIVFLEFEGVYKDALVYVNGAYITHHNYGYTRFFANISNYINYGTKNVLKVIATTNDDSRWYSGAGIYRDVNIIYYNKYHFDFSGLKIHTTSIENNKANLSIKIKSNVRKFLIKYQILDMQNNIVKQFESNSTSFSVNLENPNTWDEDNPYLYVIKASLYVNNKLYDSIEEKFGVRTIKIDAKNGLLINDKSVKLRGACIHHDNGIIGANTYRSIEDRKIRKLKEAGFNAVRISHHPAGRYVLEACDKYGIYVLNEAFDIWRKNKSDNDYALVFDYCYKEDIKAMIDLDYNHPCVIMRSLGNEIADLANESGVNTLKELVKETKKHDSYRPTTCAINGVMLMIEAGEVYSLLNGDSSESKKDVNETMSKIRENIKAFHKGPIMNRFLEKPASLLDVVGYNYMPERYEVDLLENPNRVILGTESYPFEIGEIWNYVKSHNNVIGDFLWTGWDYLGEAGIGKVSYDKNSVSSGIYGKYPYLCGEVGDIDIIGNRTIASYYHEIVYGLREKPYIGVKHPKTYKEEPNYSLWSFYDVKHVWNFKGYENMPCEVYVFSNAKEISLYVNNKLIDTLPVTNNKVIFDTIYEVGEIKAVDNNKNENVIYTPSNNKELRVEVFDDELIYVEISLVDENNNLITNGDISLTIEVNNATLLGFGNAKYETLETFTDNISNTYLGKALAIIRKDNEKEIEIIINGLNQKIIKKY